MAVFNNFLNQRRVIHEVECGPLFEKTVWEEIKKVAFEAERNNYVLTRPGDHDVIGPWLQQVIQNVAQLEEKVASLTAALKIVQVTPRLESTPRLEVTPRLESTLRLESTPRVESTPRRKRCSAPP